MRLKLSAILIVFSLLLNTQCAFTRNLTGSTGKQEALQALVSTTRTAVLLMTAAGIAYNAGAFGAPGSANAEATWNKIAAQSVLISGALNDWQAAVKAGKDASAFASIVGQALAIIGAVLPPANRAQALTLPFPTEDIAHSIGRLACPDSQRAWSLQLAGGAR